ncbi:MAG: ThuA domain-containing protein [Polyangiaceae bacterium]
MRPRRLRGRREHLETTSSTGTNTTATTGGTGGTGGAAGSGGTATTTTDTPTGPRHLLLFSRTTGFKHASIPKAVDALTTRATAEGWEVTATEDPTFFVADNLKSVSVAAFVMTSGDVLDDAQQAAFESFIQSGGGFVGVHSATDTEYDWPWYGGLVGGYFKAHPAIQGASLRVERPSHASTHHLPPVWSRTDEWYSFQANPRQDLIVLLSLDETSYDTGGTAMGDHPIAWYHGWDGGRSFYTALGHTEESWSEPAFLDHVWGGIAWAAGTDWDQLALSELDGVEAPGTWQRLQAPTDFPFTVSADGMTMTDTTGLNQHVVREGLTLDPARPYAMEALFRIAPGNDALNSFCFDLNLDAAGVDKDKVNTWATNVDLGAAPGTGVMKHMGFVSGGFAQIGETLITWGQKDVEYLLRAEVNVDEQGAAAPGIVTVTVLHDGIPVEKHSVDYASFPYQPPDNGPVMIGANTHGTDWSMRSLRVYYLDGPP